MHTDKIRDSILNAREKRAFLREDRALSDSASLTLSLNVPGYPKSSPLLSAFFDTVLSDLKRQLQAGRIGIEAEREIRQTDAAGDFYMVPVCDRRPLAELKTFCEDFEERHPLGRAIDLDLADSRLRPVSSQKLKRCLLCEKPAIVCRRQRTHSYAKLRAHLAASIEGYLSAQKAHRICRQLASLALRGVLYEIAASPKPGLVDRFEQGAHRDMDYFTFLDSTAAIAGGFEKLAASGFGCREDELHKALPSLRTIGLEMEEAMFAATHGVNTQKGLVFLIGLALYAAAHVVAHDGTFRSAACRKAMAAICKDMVRNELAVPEKDPSSPSVSGSRRCTAEYGGARREAEQGMPSVFDEGLPELRAALAGAGDVVTAGRMNEALTRTLLRLMAVVADTNILNRGGLSALMTVQNMARQVLAAPDGKEAEDHFEELIAYCKRRFVSPGGSADLLAVTVFFYFVERAFPDPAAEREQT